MAQNLGRRLPGFWSLQAGCWTLMYMLCLAAAFPHLRESFVFAYNTWVILLLFSASLALRPLLRYVRDRQNLTWLQLQAYAFGLSLVAGTVATLLTALFTFGPRGFRLSYWTLSGVQSAIVLFLWATMYLGVKYWRTSPEAGVRDTAAPAASPEMETAVGSELESHFATKFVVRVGTRIQVVGVNQVLWIAAARDYVEMHTDTSVHTLRETLTSLEERLDPEHFLRIHRSRIVRMDQILELAPLDNGEYRVKLRDGTEHRSSRTYTAAICKWMRAGNE